MPSGFRPRLAASASLMITAAEAPSESWLALPAVIHLSGPITGCSLARPSMLVSGRLPSSLVSFTVFLVVSLVFLSVTSIVVSIGTISSSNLPACWPAAVRSWLCSEYSSCASRLIL